MQPKLPLSVGVLYECLNPKCFYEGSLMGLDDVEWKHFWNKEVDDLDFRCVLRS